MEENWKSAEKEKPPVDEKTLLSHQLVVKTNHGYFNTGYWSGRSKSWLLDGPTSRTEKVEQWMELHK